MLRGVLLFVFACSSPASRGGSAGLARGGDEATSSTESAAFCAALVGGDQVAATEALADALVASGASKQRDPTDRLLAWLERQPCYFSVDLDPVLIDTEPPIRKIRIIVKDGTARVACDAELRLAPGGEVALIGCKPMAGV